MKNLGRNFDEIKQTGRVELQATPGRTRSPRLAAPASTAPLGPAAAPSHSASTEVTPSRARSDPGSPSNSTSSATRRPQVWHPPRPRIAATSSVTLFRVCPSVESVRCAIFQGTRLWFAFHWLASFRFLARGAGQATPAKVGLPACESRSQRQRQGLLGLDRGHAKPRQIRLRIARKFHLQGDQPSAGKAPRAAENGGDEFRHPLSGLSLGGESETRGFPGARVSGCPLARFLSLFLRAEQVRPAPANSRLPCWPDAPSAT